jgi:hypothetical protein
MFSSENLLNGSLIINKYKDDVPVDRHFLFHLALRGILFSYIFLLITLFLNFLFLIWLMLCLLLSGVSTNPPQLEQDSCSWVAHLQASQSSSHSNQSKFRAWQPGMIDLKF